MRGYYGMNGSEESDTRQKEAKIKERR